MKPIDLSRLAREAGVVFAPVLMWVSWAGAAQAQMGNACFDVFPGSWRLTASADPERALGAPDAIGDSVRKDLPRRLQFLDLPNDRERFVLHVPEGALDTPHSFRSWSGTSDSVSFWFSTGFSGTTTQVYREGAQWRGWSRTFSDNLPHQAYERPVTLEPIDCDQPPLQPADLDPPLPREVAFEGMPRVEVGEPLPDLWSGALGSEDWATGIEVTGVFTGPDSVRVRLTQDALVSGIDLVYRSDFDSTPISEHLQQLMAADELTGFPRWENRTTRLMIRTFDFGQVVTINDPRLRFR